MPRQEIPPVLARLDRRSASRFQPWALLAGAGLAAALVWLFRETRDEAGVDLVQIQNTVLDLTGNSDVEARHLGDGIVELVGEVSTPELAQKLVGSLDGTPGVSIVLDRLWVRPPRLVS